MNAFARPPGVYTQDRIESQMAVIHTHSNTVVLKNEGVQPWMELTEGFKATASAIPISSPPPEIRSPSSWRSHPAAQLHPRVMSQSRRCLPEEGWQTW